jgi:hypothetical protein
MRTCFVYSLTILLHHFLRCGITRCLRLQGVGLRVGAYNGRVGTQHRPRAILLPRAGKRRNACRWCAIL